MAARATDPRPPGCALSGGHKLPFPCIGGQRGRRRLHDIRFHIQRFASQDAFGWLQVLGLPDRDKA
jgi:hypothetical protein